MSVDVACSSCWVEEADLTDDDYAQMAKVVSDAHRHLAQGGRAEDKEHSRCSYSPMNWAPRPLQVSLQAATASPDPRHASRRASSTGSGRPK
jgi:hypothetical protein